MSDHIVGTAHCDRVLRAQTVERLQRLAQPQQRFLSTNRYLVDHGKHSLEIGFFVGTRRLARHSSIVKEIVCRLEQSRAAG